MSEKADEIRQELQTITHGSEGIRKENDKTEWERGYEKSRELALQIFNKRILEQKGSPLTVQEIEAMRKFKLSGFFKDTESGQKWELILDRNPNWGLNEGLPGTRVTIFDYSRQGHRVLSEWTDAERGAKFDDVYDIGWRINPNGIYNYDSRRNFKLPLLPIFREASEGERGKDVEGIRRVNALLERTLKHPDIVKSSRHKVKLPSR